MGSTSIFQIDKSILDAPSILDFQYQNIDVSNWSIHWLPASHLGIQELSI